jgi:hypothetical protein
MRPPLITAAAVLFLLPASAAGAAGLPPGIQGGAGVLSPSGDARFVALSSASRESTIVARVAVSSGLVERSRSIAGKWAVPQVALDGTGGGISGDSRTLVLVRPRNRFPMRETRYVVLDTARLGVLKQVTLRGDFGYDALSPDGSAMYLIKYLRAGDPTRYEVRAYDLTSSRLLPKPIVDPHDEGDDMRGYPLTRVASAGGRWAYTLYDGNGTHPFVHALDTVGRTAVCIDLDQLADRRELGSLRLRLSHGERKLSVMDSAKPLLVVDTKSFKVSEPRDAAPTAVQRTAAPKSETDGGGFPWLLIVLIAAVATGVAGVRLAASART